MISHRVGYSCALLLVLLLVYSVFSDDTKTISRSRINLFPKSVPEHPQETSVKFVYNKQMPYMSPMPHLLWVPQPMKESMTLPLIVFLHGAGESGTDPNNIVSVGSTGTLPHMAQSGSSDRGLLAKFVLVSPQTNDGWCTASTVEAVEALVQYVISHLPFVDSSRIYLTGVSVGGSGAWCLGSSRPRLFAAVVPICGYSHDLNSDITPLAAYRVPLWVAHGANDVVVSVKASDDMVQLCRRTKGCNLHEYSRYPVSSTPTGYPQSEGHASWKELYSNRTFWDWLLSQKLRK